MQNGYSSTTSSSSVSSILLSSQSSTLPVSDLFERRELVGKGAYGGVYKALHKPSGTVVALKVIDLDTPDDDISEIQKEVAILSEMRDAERYNITLYHGCYLSGTELWIAMDFASGGSIRTLMKSGSIDEKYIVLIVREVLIALAFLHRQNIIHRDVKAANVLLTQVGRIILADFGVAAHLQTNNKRSTFIGTPLWMAPEVITDGKLYDTKADIWSLGITMYEIATGNPPYSGIEPLRACALIPRTAPAKLEGGTWSPGMRDFLALCLQIDPLTRPSAEELSKTKWIKAANKMPMALLRELIMRYVGWIQSGGQRTSLVGLDMIQREDTFDIEEEEDSWDFDGQEEVSRLSLSVVPLRELNVAIKEPIEPLGDEPPRSLDAQAAISNIRPPKPATFSRNHHLLRLFDASQNPYEAPPPVVSNFSSGIASMDTVRPMISIPSFEEMDDMAASSGPSLKFMDMALAGGADLMSPATLKKSPFSWTNQQSAASASSATNGEQSSPMLGRSQTPDSGWGGGGNPDPWGSMTSTPTDSTFPFNAPVSTSPSLPSMPAMSAPFGGGFLDAESSSLNRPFTPSRRRADTAPSFEPPPFTMGFTQSQGPSASYGGSYGAKDAPLSASSNSSFSSSNASSYSPFGLPTPSHSNNPSLSSLNAGNGVPNVAPSPPTSNRPFGFGGRPRPDPSSGGFGGLDANRPFRERKGSDAAGLGAYTPPVRGSTMPMVQGRPRTASDPRKKEGLRIVTNGSHLTNGRDTSPSPDFTPTSAYFSPPSAPPSPTPPSASASFPPIISTTTPNTTTYVHPRTNSEGFPFPGEGDEDEPSTSEPWPTGPTLRPLDYAKLVTAGDVHLELERTVEELGLWLGAVEGGLERILTSRSGDASRERRGKA